MLQSTMAGRNSLVVFIALLLYTHRTLAEQEVTSTTTVTGPKTSVSASATLTEAKPGTAGGSSNSSSNSSSSAAAAGNSAQPAGAPGGNNLSTLKTTFNSKLAALQQTMGPVLSKAGVTSDGLKELLGPLGASAANMLSGLDAVRSAYEKTLKGYYSLLLDNSRQLRNTLEDGDTVIKNIYTLRGAKCTDAKFDPPAAKPARLTGSAGKFSITTGGCELTRVAAPLKLDYVLTCTEPGVSLNTKAPRYTSRFVSAAAASTKECKVTRKYGVESSTTITLLDPAAFFAAAVEPSKPKAAPANSTTDGPNKGAAWYKGMFPVDGKAGQRFQFVPPGVADAVSKALKEIKVENTFSYKPFSLKAGLQEAADSIVAILEQKLKVTSKTVQIFKEAGEYWSNTDDIAKEMSKLSFKNNLHESMSAMNMSSLFDGIFAKKASALLSKTPLAGQVGSGKLAAAAAGMLGSQMAGEQPMRTLLAQARQGAGQPVAAKISSSFEQAMQAMMASIKARAADGKADGSAMQGPTLGQLLRQSPETAQNIKQLAGMLKQATEHLGLGV